jgi:NitT/TauT family transport system permease protein/sulfonate transport system permease protein
VVLRALIGAVTVPIGRYTIQYHVLISLGRVMIAYLAACVSATRWAWRWRATRWAEAVFRPFYETIRPIPPIAWISMAILWFGLGEMMKYFIIFLSAFASITYTPFPARRRWNQRSSARPGCWVPADCIFLPPSCCPLGAVRVLGHAGGAGTSWATVVAAEMVRSSEGSAGSSSAAWSPTTCSRSWWAS